MAVSGDKLFWVSQNEELNTEVEGCLQWAPWEGGPILVDAVRPWDVAIVDTAWIPEPATTALLAFGGTLVVRRRHDPRFLQALRRASAFLGAV